MGGREERTFIVGVDALFEIDAPDAAKAERILRWKLNDAGDPEIPEGGCKTYEELPPDDD